ncbi:MAG TPA: hypothetical protein VFH47_08190 [Candidatus Thermoplasmatota archaeon]|nr:hypothetical protein [Candidatus Thermoplasmatota archaeon]
MSEGRHAGRRRPDRRTPAQRLRARHVARGADAGVSSVVSAVLVFALFVTVATLYAAQTLPERIADREAAHQAVVTDAFTGMRSSLDVLSARGDRGPATAAVDLAPSPVGMLQRAAATGVLSLEGTFGVNAAFAQPRVLSATGVGQVMPEEPADGDVLAGVRTLESLMLGLATSGVVGNEAAWVQVAVTDGTSTVTARLMHAARPVAGCRDAELRLEVTGPAPRTQLLQCGVDSNLPQYRLELLDPSLPFSAAASRLGSPWTVTLTTGQTGAASATGTWAGIWQDADGMQYKGTGSPSVVPVSQEGTRLVHDPQYQAFVDESTIWEGGAVLRAQGDRATVAVPPTFSLRVADGVGQLTWTMVELGGSGARAGGGAATLTITHTGTQEVFLRADGATFTLTSAHAAAWTTFLQDAALVGGALDHVAVVHDGQEARLDLLPGVEWRMRLRLVSATADIQ